MKHTIIIEYCPKCNWLLRAAYFAQEFLTTFEEEIGGLTLIPSETNGRFTIQVNGSIVFDRKVFGGFPEIKALKQSVRDIIAPGKSLGHADTPSHRSNS